MGTDRGELFLFDNDGKQIWKRSLGIGKLVSMCVSHDEKIAFIGEQSHRGIYMQLILPAAIYYGSLLRRMLLALSLQNVPIQVLSIFVLIK